MYYEQITKKGTEWRIGPADATFCVTFYFFVIMTPNLIDVFNARKVAAEMG
jgi:hypothetical protein